MGVVNVSRPMSGTSAEDLSQLCHDLRQYVAAGLLLSETSSAAIDDGAVLGRMSLIHQQFTAIAELLDVEQDAGHQIGGVNLTQLAGECADIVRLTHRVSVIFERSALVVAAGDQVLLRRADRKPARQRMPGGRRRGHGSGPRRNCRRRSLRRGVRRRSWLR